MSSKESVLRQENKEQLASHQLEIYEIVRRTKELQDQLFAIADSIGQIQNTMISCPGTTQPLCEGNINCSESEFSFRIEKDGQVVTEFECGQGNYSIYIDWVDCEGNFAGDFSSGPAGMPLDVNLGSEIFVQTLSGSNTNEYRYTVPSSGISVATPALFTWGRADDDGTMRVCTKTVMVQPCETGVVTPFSQIVAGAFPNSFFPN